MQKAFLILSAITLITATIGCDNRDLNMNTDPSIKKIVIKAYPTFHNRTLLIYDVEKGDLIFDKLGNMSFIDEDLNDILVPFSYSFNKQELKYLTDTVISHLDESDFSDMEAPVIDGISTDILFIFNSNEIRKVQLSNRATPNQEKLIEFMLETVIRNCPDSSDVSYAKRILDYYK